MVEQSNDEHVRNMNFINGVRRRPIACGDHFHWANLGVMHTSKGMLGDTINGEHE